MSGQLVLSDLDPGVKDKIKKFNLRKEKNNAAIILKIDRIKKVILLDEEHEDVTIQELQHELPAHVPRYVVLSYVQTHGDGRISYPLCFIFVSPTGANPELQMLYAGSKNHLVKEIGATKVFEIREVEELTEEWLLQKLAFFH